MNKSIKTFILVSPRGKEKKVRVNEAHKRRKRIHSQHEIKRGISDMHAEERDKTLRPWNRDEKERMLGKDIKVRSKEFQVFCQP